MEDKKNEIFENKIIPEKSKLSSKEVKRERDSGIFSTNSSISTVPNLDDDISKFKRSSQSLTNTVNEESDIFSNNDSISNPFKMDDDSSSSLSFSQISTSSIISPKSQRGSCFKYFNGNHCFEKVEKFCQLSKDKQLKYSYHTPPKDEFEEIIIKNKKIERLKFEKVCPKHHKLSSDCFSNFRCFQEILVAKDLHRISERIMNDECQFEEYFNSKDELTRSYSLDTFFDNHEKFGEGFKIQKKLPKKKPS